MSTTYKTLSNYELERGKPVPSTVHALIQGNLIFALKSHYQQSYLVLPEISLDIGERPTVPDIAVYPWFEIDLLQDVIKRQDPPLTTIEILSPTQALDTLVEKTQLYFSMGVQSCWIVLPSLKAIALYDQPRRYTFFSEKDTLQDPVTSLALPMSDVFG